MTYHKPLEKETLELIEIEDSSYCETCGFNSATSYHVKYKDKDYPIFETWASCYSSPYYNGNLFVDIVKAVFEEDVILDDSKDTIEQLKEWLLLKNITLQEVYDYEEEQEC